MAGLSQGLDLNESGNGKGVFGDFYLFAGAEISCRDKCGSYYSGEHFGVV